MGPGPWVRWSLAVKRLKIMENYTTFSPKSGRGRLREIRLYFLLIVSVCQLIRFFFLPSERNYVQNTNVAWTMFSKGFKSIFHQIIYWIILFHTTSEVLDALPLLAVWGLWGPWSACSRKKYCQEGQQHRRRICVTLEDSAHCVGVSMEARDCPAASCVHACKQSLWNLKELCHQFYQNLNSKNCQKLSKTEKWSL